MKRLLLISLCTSSTLMYGDLNTDSCANKRKLETCTYYVNNDQNRTKDNGMCFGTPPDLQCYWDWTID